MKIVPHSRNYAPAEVSSNMKDVSQVENVSGRLMLEAQEEK